MISHKIPPDKIFPRSYMDFEYQKDPGMNRVKNNTPLVMITPIFSSICQCFRIGKEVRRRYGSPIMDVCPQLLKGKRCLFLRSSSTSDVTRSTKV